VSLRDAILFFDNNPDFFYKYIKEVAEMSICIEACARALERDILAKTRNRVATRAIMARIYHRLTILVPHSVLEGKFQTRTDSLKHYLQHFRNVIAESG